MKNELYPSFSDGGPQDESLKYAGLCKCSEAVVPVEFQNNRNRGRALSGREVRTNNTIRLEPWLLARARALAPNLSKTSVIELALREWIARNEALEKEPDRATDTSYPQRG